MNDIIKLQKNAAFFEEEGNKYCLVSLIGKEVTYKEVECHSNFCILQIIDAYKQDFLTSKQANDLINKVDLFNYCQDMLGPRKIVEKLNKEVVEEGLNMPYFNSLCVLCEDCYDSY